ncbi:TWiK family of potassium channel [Ditylenchus destructor]|nr:TWiK family of potassium channel [Ditylenchus destructor]
MDLENIVERAVAIHEGREPPADTNEEPAPPKEPWPAEKDENDNPRSPENEPFLPRAPHNEFIIRSHALETLSDASVSPTGEVPPPNKPFDVCNLVAIDMDPEDLAEEQAIDWDEPLVVFGRPHEEVVERSSIASPDELDLTLPIVILDDSDKVVDAEPRKFKEKKQKYGRDAKKLYATYQEEWERLERLSDRKLGPRRKSILTLSGSSSPAATSSIIPTMISPGQYFTITARGVNDSSRASTSSPSPTKALSPPSPVGCRSESPLPSRLSPIMGDRLSSHTNSSSRRSSSSAGIKKIDPQIYKKFGETVLPPKKI